VSPKRSLLFLVVALALVTSACGSSDVTAVDVGADQPIPVEPDGGIGDGAGPIPGSPDDSVDQGTWHGAEVAVTNCPGIEWQRVQAAEFSFSVPADYVQQDVQPFDSEIGRWNGGTNVEVSYDYGPYSGSISRMSGAQNEPINYSGIVGELTVVGEGDERWVGVLFEEVKFVNDEWDRLSLTVRHDDPNDEIIGRCIVGSIQWS